MAEWLVTVMRCTTDSNVTAKTFRWYRGCIIDKPMVLGVVLVVVVCCVVCLSSPTRGKQSKRLPW